MSSTSLRTTPHHDDPSAATALPPESARGSDYAGLRRAVTAARLLDRTPVRYALRAAVLLGALAACWWLLDVVGGSWLALLVAAAMGAVTTQIAFLGHDGGHQQVSARRAGNTTVGLLAGNLLTGLSFGWWVDKHNRHHANPNREDHDPDIGEGVLAFTSAQAARRRGWLATSITRHQAAWFFPLLTLEGLNLHVAGATYLRHRPPGARRRLEVALLAVHTAGYLGGLALLLPPVEAIAFLGVHQAVFGFYMGCSFAPNHKGMPIIGSAQKVDYLRRQVLTSRNVRGGWLVDHLLGGLNYQIEHHLFPSMPRSNLRRARTIVRDYCALHRISYTETSLARSYLIVLQHLHALGQPLRDVRAAVALP